LTTALSGLTIVVTRPRESAEASAAALRGAGAETLVMPLLDVVGVEPTLASASPSPPRPPEAIIFVSTNAALYGVPALSRYRLIADRDRGQRIYAVGRATAKRLQNLGIREVFTPTEGEDSEALLAMPTLQDCVGETILLVKGDSEGGGRPLIAETLAARGATVENFICYRRGPRTLNDAERAQLSTAVQAGAWVLVGSIETLDSLVTALQSLQLSLAQVARLLVPHPRVAAAATAAGALRVTVVSLEDNKLVESLMKQRA